MTHFLKGVEKRRNHDKALFFKKKQQNKRNHDQKMEGSTRKKRKNTKYIQTWIPKNIEKYKNFAFWGRSRVGQRFSEIGVICPEPLPAHRSEATATNPKVTPAKAK